MVDFKDLQVKVISEKENTGSYEISPLPRGYGHTLANSLRRILFSSLEGATPTSVKIKGVEHEYTTLPGVKEDVVEIILNVKALKFSMSESKPQTAKLKVTGKKVVTAKDLEVTGSLTVVDPDAHIATLTDASSSIELEITVEKGVGYKPAEDERRSDAGVIPLDADFSPIKKVSFEVTATRKGQETDLDAVQITVITDGSIKPIDALLNSAKILQEFAGKVMAALGVPVTEVEQAAEKAREIEVAEQAAEESVSDEVLSWKIEDLPISKRSKTGLLSGGYKTIEDLRGVTSVELLNLPGFGNKSLSEVIDLLSQYNIEVRS